MKHYFAHFQKAVRGGYWVLNLFLEKTVRGAVRRYWVLNLFLEKTVRGGTEFLQQRPES